MAAKFFLDAAGGSLAFMKEQDFPDWANGTYEADGNTNMAAVPSVPFDPAEPILDVRNIRRAIVLIKLAVPADVFTFTFYAGANSNEATMNGWYPMDGGTYSGVTGDQFVGVDVFGVDYLSLVLDTPPAGGCEVQLAAIPYEVTS